MTAALKAASQSPRLVHRRWMCRRPVPFLWLFLGFTSASLCGRALHAQTCVSPPSGLVGWWRGEGDATDSAGSNNGTIHGGVTFAAGMVGPAFSLNGVDGWIEIPDDPSLNFSPTSPMSIELWAFPVVQQSIAHFVGKRDPSCGSSFEYQLGVDPNAGLFFNGSSGGGVFTGQQLPLNTWTHLAATFDGNNFTFYTNGVLAGSGTGTLGPANNDSLAIGTSGGCPFFQGLIDEMSLYNRALSQTEIQSIYLAQQAGKCSTPTAPYIITQPMDQAPAADSEIMLSVLGAGTYPLSYQWSYNGTNLTGATNASLIFSNIQLQASGVYQVSVSNDFGQALSDAATVSVFSPVCTASPPGLVSWWAGEGNGNDNMGTNNGSLVNGVGFKPGVVGQAFRMNGTNQYVKIPKSASLDIRDQITIDFWMNSDPSNAIGSAFEGLVTSDFYFVEMDTTPGHVGINFSISTNNGGFFPSTSDLNERGLIFPAGEWHHVAATYDGTNMQTYLDGQPSGNPRPWSGPISPMLANSFIAIGSEDGRTTCPNCHGTRYYKGLIDEVDIFNRALSSNEIMAIYNSYGAGKCPFAPAFVSQPQNSTVKAGASITLAAAAAGSNPLAYQWQFDSINLAGATNTWLTLTNVQPSNAGTYSVTVTNSLGSATSSNALLKVEVITVLGNGQVLSNAQYTFANPITVQLLNFFTNGDIFYTLDGTTPSFASTQYTGPFTVNQNVILQALGYDADFAQSGYSDPINIIFPPAYSVTATTPGGGAIQLNPSSPPYFSNSVVGLTAVASNGWSFLQWAGDASGTSPTNTVLMTTNKTIQALFGTGLTVTSSTAGTVLRLPSAPLYPYGMKVQLNALPQTNNYFALWGNAASGNLNPIYFTLTNPNPTVSALFVGMSSNQDSLVVIPVGHGKISIAPQANVFTNSQLVTITATADTNQTFLGWSGDVNGTQNPLMVSIGPSKTIFANFSKNYRFSFAPLTGLGLEAGFGLNLTGEIPVAYRFDASANLANWLPLITLTNYTGTLHYTDTNALNFNERFYRGVPLP
jgi:hypothetical protein